MAPERKPPTPVTNPETGQSGNKENMLISVLYVPDLNEELEESSTIPV